MAKSIGFNYDFQKVKNDHLYKTGSQKFPVTITDISASAFLLVGFRNNAEISQYLPLNYLRIYNTGGTDLMITVDEGAPEPIGNNEVWTHRGDFYKFLLENKSSTDTATGANIHTTVQRLPGGP